MKIFSVAQIQAWDAYTIQHEPIESIDLMERASEAFVKAFCHHFDTEKEVNIFCGMGNNGGDGLAVARLLSQRGFKIKVYLIRYTAQGSKDFQVNFQKVKEIAYPREIEKAEDIPQISQEAIIIDALFGSGLNRPLEGLLAEVINVLNQSSAIKVSIDIASGLYADTPTEGKAIFKADYTISFQAPKLAFLLPQNATYVGKWEVVNIGLHLDYEQNTASDYHLLDTLLAKSMYQPRHKFSHKGTYGHALLLVGSYGKMGAGVLATKAALRAGAGLVTAHIPTCGYNIMQTAVPEAMLSLDDKANILSQIPDLKGEKYKAIGVGCGIGKEKLTEAMLKDLLKKTKQALIFDADALNILAEMPSELQALIPKNSILTPHPKEFSRLVGESENDFDRLIVLQAFAQAYQIYIVLKGAHSVIATPDGKLFFNTTGNPGMATGGSGDVLTGIITGLLAQGYSSESASLLGVYLHGKSGDLAAEVSGQEALIASDLIDYLGKAFLFIQND
jgi:NAD(P)H-hydrate epimerase